VKNLPKRKKRPLPSDLEKQFSVEEEREGRGRGNRGRIKDRQKGVKRVEKDNRRPGVGPNKKYESATVGLNRKINNNEGG